MINLRKYGKTFCSIVLIHGGPGARGDLAPIAKVLSRREGVLEYLQTAKSINGQIRELHLILKKYAECPVILIGHSWGAWLGYIFASRYSSYVKKIILVSSGPFEEKYVPQIMKTRLSRLSSDERNDLNIYLKLMNRQKINKIDRSSLTQKNDSTLTFTKFNKIISKTDSYKQITYKYDIDFRLDIMQGVWKQAAKLRQSGKLLDLAESIKCPVIAIHGDYDPHPFLGVIKPLSRMINDFRYVILNKCGHNPWMEKYARNEFFRLLKKELT